MVQSDVVGEIYNQKNDGRAATTTLNVRPRIRACEDCGRCGLPLEVALTWMIKKFLRLSLTLSLSRWERVILRTPDSRICQRLDFPVVWENVLYNLEKRRATRIEIRLHIIHHQNFALEPEKYIHTLIAL